MGVLQLYHFSISTCSQRVRLALAEKGLAYESRPVDLGRGENRRPAYLAINPAGLVPTLVHDGEAVVESLDILRYLDRHFESPRLLPAGLEADYGPLESRADESQAGVALLSQEFLFKPVRKREPAGHADIAGALERMHGDMAILDDRLRERPWILGADFSLADIVWLPNVLRLEQMAFDLERYSGVAAWLERMRSRPSWAPAVERWIPMKIGMFMRAYTLLRRMRRSSVRDVA